jgi:hypothetical protein
VSIIQHPRPHACPILGCPRTFTTPNDLKIHEYTIHEIDGTNNIDMHRYTFNASEACRAREKRWARFDHFRQHVEIQHKDEDIEDIIGYVRQNHINTYA